MKIRNFLLCLAFILSSFFSNSQIITCNSIPDKCLAIQRPGFSLLSSEESTAYIKNYRNNFKKKDNTHTKAIYFSKDVFCLLDTFLRKYSGHYTGINTHFIVYDALMTSGQKDREQMSLYFTPVYQKRKSDYTGLRNFYETLDDKTCGKPVTTNYGQPCPKNCDLKTQEWGGNISRTYDPVTEVSLQSVLFHDPTTAMDYKRNYKKEYCRLNRKHTKFLFMYAGFFRFVGSFLKANPNCAGIGVYFASYNHRPVTGVSGQARRKQITLIFAPLFKINGRLEPSFCAFNCYHESLPGNKRLEFETIGAFSGNHGELCPKICD
jgi:hypothetical protein